MVRGCDGGADDTYDAVVGQSVCEADVRYNAARVVKANGYGNS